MASLDQAQLSRIENGLVEGSPSQLKTIAQLLGVTVSDLFGDRPTDSSSGSSYTPLNVAEQILWDIRAPEGLKELAGDVSLSAALLITDSEWICLSSLKIPVSVSKHGYLQFLAMIRVFSESRCREDPDSNTSDTPADMPAFAQP